MGQVPQHKVHRPRHLLVGSGRLARHLHHYFVHRDIAVQQWSRNADPLFNSLSLAEGAGTAQGLLTLAEPAQWIWLLIRDSEIERFVNEHPQLDRRRLVHCSGSLSLPEITSLHPLMSFGPELFPLDFYSRILFVGELGRPGLASVCPELNNPFREISSAEKARYHALCVIANNFSVLLWQSAAQEFSRWGVLWPELLPYLEATVANLSANPQTALTGPLSRGDWATVERNLGSLSDSPLRPIYESFVQLYLSSHPHRTPGEVHANA